MLIGAGLALVIVAGFEMRWRRAERIARAALQAVSRAQLEKVARERDGVIGKLLSERELNRQLSADFRAFVDAAKKADSKSRISLISKTTATIADKPPVVMVDVPGGPPECRDEYHRFGVVVRPDGTCAMWRKQLFEMDTLFIRSGDGKTRISKTEFRELDPETRAQIPTTGVDIKGNFTFADEVPPKPPIIHPRLVVGVDHRLSFGAGVELLNLERTERPFIEKLSVSLLGYYDRKSNEGRAAAQLGYRILNSNITVGPYVGVSSSGGLVFGAGAAIQVTR